MNDRSLANRVVTGVLIVVAAWAAWTASQWRYEVRFAPMVTSLALGGLALIQLLRTELPALRRRRAAAPVSPADIPAGDAPAVPAARSASDQAASAETTPARDGEPARGDARVQVAAREAATDEPPAAAEEPVGAVPEKVTAVTHTPSEGTLTREPGADDPGLLGPWKGAVWTFVCLGLVIASGILLGLPLAVFVLCRFAFGEKWLVTFGAVAVTIGVLYVFDAVFNVFWPVGLAFRWLY